MNPIESLLIDGGVIALVAYIAVTYSDIFRHALFKKMNRNTPMNQKDFARQMMANEHELEQIRHEQQKEAELAKLAIYQANRHVMEQRANAHVSAQSAATLALPVPSNIGENVNGVQMPPFVEFSEATAPETLTNLPNPPKNGKVTITPSIGGWKH